MATYTVSTIALPDDTLTALCWDTMSSHQTPAGLVTDSFPNTGHEFLYVKNINAAATTVTVNSTHSCVYGTDHNVTVSVAQNKEYMLGKFPVDRFGTTVSVSYSANYADMRVDVLRS